MPHPKQFITPQHIVNALIKTTANQGSGKTVETSSSPLGGPVSYYTINTTLDLNVLAEHLNREVYGPSQPLKLDVDIIPSEAASVARNIVTGVSVSTGVSLNDIHGPRGPKSVSNARQLAMRRIRDELKWSMPRIGRYFNRDHTTVLYALRKWPKGS